MLGNIQSNWSSSGADRSVGRGGRGFIRLWFDLRYGAMASVMGTKTVLTGIQAGVASVLVEFDVDVKRVAGAEPEAGLAMLAGWDGRDTPEAELRRSCQFDGRR